MTEATASDKQPLEHAVEPIADAEGASETGSQQPQPEAESEQGDEPRQPVENPVFADRARIAARFKAQREQRQEEIVDAAHEEIAADTPADQPQGAARTIKVKVRHEIRELPEDEVIAAAQKTLAGDGYLEEARRLLEDAKQVASSRPHRAAPILRPRTGRPMRPTRSPTRLMTIVRSPNACSSDRPTRPPRSSPSSAKPERTTPTPFAGPSTTRNGQPT